MNVDTLDRPQVETPARTLRGWRRFVVLVLLVIPSTLIGVSTSQHTAYAQVITAPAVLPASLAGRAALVVAGAGAAPVVGIAGAFACLFYCDDAYEWVVGKLSDVQWPWEEKPGIYFPASWPWEDGDPPIDGSVVLTPTIVPTHHAGGSNSEITGFTIQAQCQGPDGNVRMTKLARQAGVIYKAGGSAPSIPSRSINCASANMLDGYTGGGRLLEIVIAHEGFTGAPAASTIWQSSGPEVVATVVVKCTHPVTGEVTTVTSTATPSSLSKVTASVPDCQEALPGSVPTQVTGTQHAPWAPPSSGTTVVTRDLAPIQQEYPSCFVASSPCVLAPVQQPDGTTPCKWGPYILPDDDCTGIPVVVPTQPTTAPTPQPSTGPTPRPTATIAPPAPNPSWPNPRLPEGYPVPEGTPIITREPNPHDPTQPDCTTWTYASNTVIRNCLVPNPEAPTGPPITVVDIWPPNAPRPEPPTISTPLPPTSPNPPGESGSDCFGSTITLTNPASWVYGPFVCALKWAFVPTNGFGAHWGGVAAVAGTRIPFAWITSFGITMGPFLFIPSGQCPDWNVKVAGLTKNVVCESSMTYAIRNARPVLIAAGVLLAFSPLFRSVWYASVPILKPVPVQA